MGLSFSLDNVGPLARTVRDCARLLGVIAGHDPLDPTSSDRPVEDYEAAALAPDVSGLRIGVPRCYYYDDVPDAIREPLEVSLDRLVSLGARRVAVDLPAEHEHLAGLANVIQGSEAAGILDRVRAEMAASAVA